MEVYFFCFYENIRKETEHFVMEAWSLLFQKPAQPSTKRGGSFNGDAQALKTISLLRFA